MAIKVRPKKSTGKGTGIPLRMPANTVREDYEEGKLNVQQIMRGETPSDKKLRKGNIKLREPEKLRPVKKKTKKYGGGKVIHKKTGSKVKHANEFEGVKVKKRSGKKHIMESPPENRKIPSQEKSRTVPEHIYRLLAETFDSGISKELLREIKKQGTKKERRRASEFSSGEPHRKRKIQESFTEPKSRQQREKHVSYKSKGSKVKYRSIGGKVVDGNEITGMIYD